jgi:hypothetical protein
MYCEGIHPNQVRELNTLDSARSGLVILPVHDFVDVHPIFVRTIVARRNVETILRDWVFRILERASITAIKELVPC